MNEIQIYVPNALYRDIWQDNIDLFFERLIYSKEFYDFIKNLMIGTRELNKSIIPENLQQKELLENASKQAVHVGSKLVLDVLAKAFYNSQMTDITDVLISLYAESDAAVLSFMDYLFQDNCTYIFQILLLCTDKLSRTNT